MKVDIVLVFSDGVTDAFLPADEQFGLRRFGFSIAPTNSTTI